MARTKISEFSATPASNTDIDSINIAEGCAPSGINDAIRELMAQLKDFQTGAVGDSFNGPVGTTTAAAGAFTTLSASGNVTLGDASTDTLNVGNGGLIKDASGNLGLGVTPSAWATFKAIQVGPNAAAAFIAGNGADSWFGDSAYYNAGWKYAASGVAVSAMQQASGAFKFYTAPSGTVGNAITFKQAMTLDASGNFMVGATSALGRATIVQGASSNTDTLVLKSPNSGGAGSQPGIQFLRDTNAVLAKVFADTNTGALITDVNGAERARIDFSGNFMVGTTGAGGTGTTIYKAASGNAGAPGSIHFNGSSAATETVMSFQFNGTVVGSITRSNVATVYLTASDYRLKENVAPMTSALATVAQLKPVSYTWKTDGSNGQGFIAHELQAVVPECVVGEKDAVTESGSIKPQGIDTSFLVATLTAAIQEQQALILTLQAQLTSVSDDVAALKAAA